MPISTYPASVDYEIAWNSGPLQTFPPRLWTSIVSRVLGKWDTERGRQYERDVNEAGLWRPALDNRDGALDPSNPNSPYAPNVVPYRPAQVRCQSGVNKLSVDVATAGEGTGFLGAIPPRMHVANDAGYPLTIIASGAAFVGNQVYQAVLPSTAPAFSTVLVVQQVPVVPSTWYSFQALAQITAGSSVACAVTILWYDIDGNFLSPSAGQNPTLTSGAGSWTELTTSGLAPSNAYSASLKVETTAAISASTTFLLDALQWEGSATPTTWQMPGTLGANLLPRAIATGTQSIDPVTDSAAAWFYSAAGSIAQGLYLPAAPSGQTTAVAWTTPAGTTNASPLYCGAALPAANNPTGPVENILQVAGNTQYTFSTYLMRLASADATVVVMVSVRWFDINGNLISTASGSGATVPTLGTWARGTCTATSPANAVWGRPRFYISTPASTTAQNTIYTTGWQAEAAGSASTWTDPGVIRHVWAGYGEQFPQIWRLSGTWGELDGIGTDILGGLGSDVLQDPFVEEVLELNPNYFYQLNDAIGAVNFADSAAVRPAATVLNASPYGSGTVAAGSAITSTTPAEAFLGGAGPVVTITNPTFGSSSIGAGSGISLATPAQAGPPPTGAWTRMIAFRCPTIPTGSQSPQIWFGGTAANIPSNGSNFTVNLNPGGSLSIGVAGASSGIAGIAPAGTFCDGNWHLVMFGLDAGGLTLYAWVDGTAYTHASPGGDLHPVGLGVDLLGMVLQTGTLGATFDYSGDLAFATELPLLLTNAQATNLYNSWRTASSGESSGARAARILGWVGYTGPTAIDVGATGDMGPATDASGQSTLSALNSVATSENGNMYAAANGVPTFKARTDRYNRNSPKFVFGERQQFGEWPYEDVQLPTDPIHTYNDVQISQYSPFAGSPTFATQQTAVAISRASQQQNFGRVLQQTINVESFAEVQSAAQYALGQYQTPMMRSKGLKLHPSAVPGLFEVCLQLEIGTRIRQMKRPPWSTDVIQFDGFVERVAWSLDPRKGGEVFVTLECSPADRAQYWVLAALHTNLTAIANSGTNQATIAGLPDSAVNALASSLPTGYQLVFEPGTPRQETMTIAPGGIPATSPGWASATLTFTTSFAFTHPANSAVCEPLPAGYTDPTRWDLLSVLGAAYTTVLSGGGSGTNNVTVGPLQDGAVNALGSDWNTGDVIQLSPGTANVETATIASVAASNAGYGSCQITFTANLAHSHAVGDYVCDVLPGAITNPTAVAATARLAY